MFVLGLWKAGSKYCLNLYNLGITVQYEWGRGGTVFFVFEIFPIRCKFEINSVTFSEQNYI